MAPKRDGFTADLFRDYQPAPVVDRFEEEEVRAFSLNGRLSKAVALALAASGQSRDELAAAMSEFLGDNVSTSMLDKYASQAAEGHSISALRLVALAAVTNDVRPLNALLADVDLIVVPKKYEALLRREKARELKERMEREESAADAEWKARR
ncbi:MAG: hypothetical protein WD928_14615 [Gammaproteobacteria bacterium]